MAGDCAKILRTRVTQGRLGGNLKKTNVRKYPRVPSKFAVEYTVGDKKLSANASTLGGGGLFLKECKELSPGMELRVRFRPAKHLPFIEAGAKVCYVEPDDGAGLEFTEISLEQHQTLLRLIHHKTANRRQFPRAPLATQLQCEGCMALAYSRDVSPGGMFVETTVPCEIGAHVELRFHLTDEGPVILAQAEVKYVVPKLGMGVEFIDLSPSDRERLENYVKGSAASPSDTVNQTGSQD
jgi:c-di-GMP-binding flagellar brake protein YcgR